MEKNNGKEFSEFLSAQAQVPQELTIDLRTIVAADLSPSKLKVFAKTSSIQFLVGAVTLLFCPQFGVAFTSHMGLMSLLMKFGDTVCMFGCGALFTSLSLLASSLLLKPEEVRALRASSILQLGFLSTLSLGALVCLGGQVVVLLGLTWLIGAFIGGLVSLEVGWGLRQKLVRTAA